MSDALGALRGVTGGRVPKWSPALPRPAHFAPVPPVAPTAVAQRLERVVYFPSCAARNMGPQRGDDAEPLPVAAERLFRKAGYDVVYPRDLQNLCCGQPFESKGFVEAADRKSAELEAALRDASENGHLAIVSTRVRALTGCDDSCRDRLPVATASSSSHDPVLARVTSRRTRLPVAIHPVCSVRKMGYRRQARRDRRGAAAARSSRSMRSCAAALQGTRASIGRNSTSTRCAI